MGSGSALIAGEFQFHAEYCTNGNSPKCTLYSVLEDTLWRTLLFFFLTEANEVDNTDEILLEGIFKHLPRTYVKDLDELLPEAVEAAAISIDLVMKFVECWNTRPDSLC